MEPAQSRPSERAFHIVAFGKCFQAHLAKTGSENGIPDAQGLLRGRDPVALAAGDENLRAEKARAGMEFPNAFAKQIFVHSGEIKAGDAVAFNREQGSDEAGALG